MPTDNKVVKHAVRVWFVRSETHDGHVTSPLFFSHRQLNNYLRQYPLRKDELGEYIDAEQILI